MSQHLSLDAATFEGLLAAVWVLQRHHEQEDRIHRPAANAMEGEAPETQDSDDISERDTTNARLVLSVLSKAANKSQGSMRVRCANCNHQSAPRSRFCGMCGAQLLESQPTREIEPQVETKPAREPVPPLSGSFFPGVAAEPDNSFVYSLEDRGSIFHWGRSFILIALFGCVAAAASYWYRDLRDVAARLSQQESTPPVPIVRPATGMTTPNNRMPADHKIRSVADGIRDKPLPKPSAGIPLDSVPRATRHRVRIISSVRRRASGPRKLARNNHQHASGTIRAGAVAPATSSAIDELPGESLHDSENQAERDAQNVMDQNQETQSNRNMQSPRDDAGGKGAAVATRHYVPRPPPGFGTSNIAARAGHKIPRPPPEGVAATNETNADESGSNDSRSNDREIPMNRVPRPPQR